MTARSEQRRLARCKEEREEYTPTPESASQGDGGQDTPDAVRQELERIAFGPADSGRAMLAKVTALRSLDRLNHRGLKPAPPCPADWVPGPSQFEALDRAHLDATPGARERWWKNLWEQGIIDADGRYAGPPHRKAA